MSKSLEELKNEFRLKFISDNWGKRFECNIVDYTINSSWDAAIKAVSEMEKELIEALEFYADRNNWCGYSNSHHEMMNESDHEITEDTIIVSALFDSSPDCEEIEHEVNISRAGKIAREALKDYRGMK